MTTTTQPSVAEQIAAAIAARDEGFAAAEDADRTGWDRQLIDQAIDYFAATGERFSANDLRPLLPDVRPALLGARFYAAVTGGRIRPVGLAASTKRNTHNKRIGLYIGADHTT